MNMSMDLDAVKYTDLQRLAKDVGLKANMKADKLLKALKEFYQQQQEENKGANADEVDPVKAELREVNARSPVVASSAFITKRRGRGQKAKRKQPEDEEDGAEAEFNTAEDIAQSEEKIEEGSNKKRRLSEGQGSESGTQEEKHTKSTEKTEVKAGKEAGRKSVKPSKIPRHDGFRKTESRLKPTTPNFKKLHEAHFSKMESIDSYVQRKAKQMAVFRNSVKELKKPNVSRASLFSPVANGKRQSSENRKLTRSSTSKPVLKDTSAFKPTVLSTCKMNVRFSQTTQDNEHKRSLIKTPARMSPHVALTSTPGTRPNSQIKPAVSSNNLRTPGTFVFNGNASSSTTPGTNKKNAFDLKASLSRPLTYQPHKGKLKPFGMTQENTSLNKSQTTLSQQKNYKQHQVQTREDRRVKHKEDRKQKKEKMLRARRGLVMA
ncbi:nucleolar and spindle-associated protein 1 isoform X2 [Scleropages formosus]|uniref:Nucleolar and spindle associated protein 1 n=1 Tax=Scleropages formosus TaxID=113540 RepID=A0A8C9V1E5_SCLFO|nr:nucleolar and spindle-associated protein 1 isoform X2 [Scleropages formosus]